MFGYKKLSLNRKIMMIAVAAIVPMICLVCYLLWTISYTTGVYADITNNVAEWKEQRTIGSLINTLSAMP